MTHMNSMKQHHWHQSFVLLLLLATVASTSLLIRAQLKRNEQKPITIGITYSTKYAYWLGLDAHKSFVKMMDELGAKDIRVPMYWSDIEKQPGVYDWNEVKWLLDEAAKRDAKITLAVGMRVPRYPECFVPDWARSLSQEEFQKQLLAYLGAAGKALDPKPALVRWQVENEPFFASFGECPQPDEELFAAEIDTMRAVTNKPLMTTASGEFGSWIREAKYVDTLGVSLYRGAVLEKIGYFDYPIPSWYYIVRRQLASQVVKQSLISELQVEPWLKDDTQKIPLDEQLRGMSIEKVKSNVKYAKATGFPEIWLWGPEWWLYLKEKHGVQQYWDLGKSLFD